MDKKFEILLSDTPECNDFRRLADGWWVAYSTRLGPNGLPIRQVAPTIREALEGLRETLEYAK